MVYANHERLKGRTPRPLTMDAAQPRREETSGQCVERLTREGRSRSQHTRNEVMPMPSGILPEVPPIDPRTGIPLPGFGWLMPRTIAAMKPENRAMAYRANDAARSQRLLHGMNEANARFGGQRR